MMDVGLKYDGRNRRHAMTPLRGRYRPHEDLNNEQHRQLAICVGIPMQWLYEDLIVNT